MKTELYKKAKAELISNGVNFNKGYYELTDNEKAIIKETGKKVGYKSNYKGNSSIMSYAGRFYLLLQKL